MKYLTIPPAPRFREIIRSYWLLESDEPYTHHSMADMCPELLFHYDGRFNEIFKNGKQESSFTAGIHGQSRVIRQFHITSGFGMFGVYFYPHAIPLLFNIPASDLTNQVPELSLLLKSTGLALEEKIAAAHTLPERIAIIEQFVDEQLARQYDELPIFRAIRQIIATRGLINVKSVSEQYYLSERQFERQFNYFAGFSPKLFARITRFNHAVKQYGSKGKSLTEIALECGYYDQSHFIHDFKEFSGLQPKVFFAGKSPATTWMEE
ncbi:AraC family transcriptional regulator [Chitinophaga silvatica]|uniref:AraC family transcriptional regulator n=2 Tax=Chitinophaga silvatica TaxID=2282649 RepID=A0A3E1Y759_9BACT|nr:AraC family transcriptional regulator [Chitinophaga silvatica]